MPKPSANSAIIMQMNPNSPVSEAYRSLRFNIESSASGQDIKTIAITSARKGEGKTTTALNLATAFAQIGKKVLLIDADLRQPGIHLTFGMENSRGLSSFLTGQSTVGEIIRDSYVDNLSLMMAGPVPAQPTELLASKQMTALLAELRESYDMIFIDTPSVLALTDGKILAAQCDGILLVIEYGKLKRNVAKKVKEDLLLAKTKLMGVVLNKVSYQDAEAYL
ncbi:CpsD/CapB family tyrosine-protein kinase [Paenibacillus rigui]|uniref:non-specific protein-tyrosine kinase n=1 Tax=Paenibacillus rigui TaxID=554312 RepID=A0A229UPJ7_9BACL|nr:CpsD/CapB family tyrosine-protein kinase [Paenibacillus rigui]OXM85201.1 capsular biosynthesis protein [Paenibacillus rigui]